MEPDILDCSADHLQKCEASSDVIANLIFVSEGNENHFYFLLSIVQRGGGPAQIEFDTFFKHKRLPKLLSNVPREGLPKLILILF